MSKGFRIHEQRPLMTQGATHPLALHALPANAVSWVHLRRVLQRWWRLWVYALSGLMLGILASYLIHPEVSENHTQAKQALASLQQKLAATPQVSVVPIDPALRDQVQLQATHLPGLARQGQLWADWQKVLATHGLHLLSLQPVAARAHAKPAPTGDEVDTHSSWPYQSAALRMTGRFEDWSRVWLACAEAGPVCTMEQLRVSSSQDVAEVQIDVVLRLWMYPDAHPPTERAQEGGEQSDATQTQQHAWVEPLLRGRGPHWGATLFAPEKDFTQSVQLRSEGLVSAKNMGGLDVIDSLTDIPPPEILSPNPHHWPMAHVRLLGVWRLGHERHAILSAGKHWAKVAPGQRVTLEGHRVQAIHDDGVSLRLDAGPVHKLNWLTPADRRKNKGSDQQ